MSITASKYLTGTYVPSYLLEAVLQRGCFCFCLDYKPKISAYIGMYSYITVKTYREKPVPSEARHKVGNLRVRRTVIVVYLGFTMFDSSSVSSYVSPIWFSHSADGSRVLPTRRPDRCEGCILEKYLIFKGEKQNKTSTNRWQRMKSNPFHAPLDYFRWEPISVSGRRTCWQEKTVCMTPVTLCLEERQRTLAILDDRLYLPCYCSNKRLLLLFRKKAPMGKTTNSSILLLFIRSGRGSQIVLALFTNKHLNGVLSVIDNLDERQIAGS